MEPILTPEDHLGTDAVASRSAAASPFGKLPAPLAAALEARGYGTPTEVQRAVLDAARGGGDLRIASRTGSGKTVALGIVMAPALDAASADRRGPLALVVAPTRELAAQVREELGWLYADLDGVRVECVTGGTHVGAERRRLAGRPAVLVGTPGRLLDHLRGGVLDLADLRELVLDEADQMLDLGFRDELEALFAATPQERRTHLVSATFPEGVARLAERYQRDSLMVEGAGMGEAHADIEHVAHAVRGDDRFAVLVNTLLLAEGARCLVFVRTRADASGLADELAREGFAALALSGELQQSQRERTLAAFKNGSAPVLVATDVAARGLDVHDVSLVVHYATPRAGEDYVHRSGRTGRAGKRGTSLLFVPASQRRRVDRLLGEEGVRLDWRDAPNADLVRAELSQREERRLAVAVDADADTVRLEAARRLLAGRDAERVVAALLERVRSETACEPKNLRARTPRLEREGGRGDRPDREERRSPRRGPDRTRNAYERFFVNWGFQLGATPGRLMALVCRRGGVTSREVGAIDLGPRGTSFEIAADAARGFESKAAEPDRRDPRLRIRRDLGRPGADRRPVAGRRTDARRTHVGAGRRD